MLIEINGEFVQSQFSLQNRLGVAAERGCQRAVFKWNIPTEEQLPSVLCSSEFTKFERKWRLVYSKGDILLQVIQALDQIVAFIRYFEIGARIICITQVYK